jgi:CRP-like cAMP-binding protein
LIAISQDWTNSSFVALALGLQVYFDPTASLTDHISYIAFFFSYAMGNPIGYRLIAIVASGFEIYSHVVEDRTSWQVDAIPVFYNSLFMTINTYYVLRWQLARQFFTFSEVEETLYLKCFEPLGIRRTQFRSLLRSATWHKTEDTRVVFVEGEPLRDLYVSLEGSVDVIKAGVPVTTLEPFQVIGEAALLESIGSDGSTSSPARATVVAEAGARYVSWAQADIYALMQEDREFAYAAQLMISRTLSRKLGKAREDQRGMSDYVLRLAAEAERAARERGDLPNSREVEESDEAAAAELALLAAKLDIGMS